MEQPLCVVLPVIVAQEKENLVTYILLLKPLPRTDPSHLYLRLLAKANLMVKPNFFFLKFLLEYN